MKTWIETVNDLHAMAVKDAETPGPARIVDTDIVEAPPCPRCAFWRPAITVDALSHTAEFRACHCRSMCHDFSCFIEPVK